MAEDEDVNYSEIKFAQSGDGVKQERQKDKEECAYSTVRPRHGGGSESGVSDSQGQSKPKDPSPITRSRSISVSSVPITRSKVKAGLGTCRRSPWLLLVFLLLSLLGLTIYLGVMYVFNRSSQHEIELNLTGSLSLLQSLQKDKENLTIHIRVQQEQHSNESLRLQNELKDVNATLHNKSNAYSNLLDEKKQLQEELQVLKASGAMNCASGWEYFKRKCYYFSTDQKNWADSRDACVTMGGHLVIIETPEEQDFLRRKSHTPDYWIGLTDSAKEGEWRWVDNKLLNDNKNFWDGTEPDDWKGEQRERPEGEDCARFNAHGGWKTWYDAFCTYSKNYMCESIAAIKHN
ncbi:asialoglycoprotein receptor 1-like isoform X2 [Engraulis encrasicolus]|uniref:asialoglycoprotein receptor 1-like isoform X2 n=1 Tax=Engraulis encrasicolus TaxID=184585 RepID=UPI002FCFDF8E